VVLKLGYDPVWFGVVVSAITMIGIIIPPVAINAFVVSGVTRVLVSVIYKGIYPFIVGMTICLIVFILFPQISLWLLNMLMK
jgi:C4-dicarboxylate transporter DctM subunit